MSRDTRVFFVVSSGRSGTAMLAKALGATPGVEIHHEYMVHHVQPLAVRRYLGLATSREAREVLVRTHVAAVHYSVAERWGDSSNKLAWLIPELDELFPDAHFVHLVRDGRKVVSSYARKLADECYDDRATAILQAHYDDPGRHPPPPPEKRYWWPVPRKDDPRACAFRNYCQFERIAFHWAEINRTIRTALADMPPTRRLTVRLEDLRANRRTLEALYGFLGLHCRDEDFAMFARPHNVNRPEDRLLTQQESVKFWRIAATEMHALGYAGAPEYVVSY